jgi:tetratricopeptide (TPR) repeat protein
MEVIRGHILLENGLRDDAIKAFSKAMLVSEGAPAVMLRIIVSLYDNHYINSSYVLFKRLLKYTGDDFPELADWYAYMALCCYDLQKYDEFLHYLQLAVDRSPSEARKILVDLFPADVDVKDYPEYMKGKLSV